MSAESASPSDATLDALEGRLGYRFGDRALLRLALTHRSYAFEAGGLPTNERLEFLGDAVLGLVVTDLIYRGYPDEAEGRLAKLRAAAVNTSALAQVGRGLGLGSAVLLGRGEEQSGGRDKDSILADTLEAVIGAIYLDQGLAVAQRLVSAWFADLVVSLSDRPEAVDAKTALQELLAGAGRRLPSYRLSEEGPDHAKQFAAVVYVDEVAYGHGEGRTKKEAEQGAAAEAVRRLRHVAQGRAVSSLDPVGRSDGSEADQGGRR